MSVLEQEEIKLEHYGEAIRYMDNAKEYLKNAKTEGNYYQDKKYVKTACGTAYNGLLEGLDGFLKLKNITPKGKERKTIEYYQRNVTKIDKKLLNTLISAYQILHLWGYYDGIKDARVVKLGFDQAYTLINKIKPSNILLSSRATSSSTLSAHDG